MTTHCHIAKAIAVAGSETKLAAVIGYSQVAVTKAKQRGRVSPQMAVAIESATGISRHDLRPDIFGPAPSGQHDPESPPSPPSPAGEPAPALAGAASPAGAGAVASCSTETVSVEHGGA